MFLCIHASHKSSQQYSKLGLTTSILKKRKPKVREVPSCAQGHLASKQWSWELDLSLGVWQRLKPSQNDIPLKSTLGFRAHVCELALYQHCAYWNVTQPQNNTHSSILSTAIYGPHTLSKVSLYSGFKVTQCLCPLETTANTAVSSSDMPDNSLWARGD